MTSSPFRDAPGAMAEIRRLRIASAPSTVYLHGTPVVVRLRDGPRWQINVQRERARLVENRGESELKSCENPPQVPNIASATAVSHGLTSHSYAPASEMVSVSLCTHLRHSLLSDWPGPQNTRDTLEGD